MVVSKLTITAEKVLQAACFNYAKNEQNTFRNSTLFSHMLLLHFVIQYIILIEVLDCLKYVCLPHATCQLARPLVKVSSGNSQRQSTFL